MTFAVTMQGPVNIVVEFSDGMSSEHAAVGAESRGSPGMQLRNLTVRNLRNLVSLDLELPAEGAVIIGPNGHGKTSLLEAVYYLTIFRSFRGARDRDLVRFGEGGFFVAGEGRARVTAGYDASTGRKKVTVAGQMVSRLSDAIGVVHAVPFAPTDRELSSGGPSGRRRFLDVLLSLTETGYLQKLSAYRSALRQRNAALRGGRADAARAFDAPLARAAAFLWSARFRWVEDNRLRFSQLMKELGETETAGMRYPDCPSTSQETEGSILQELAEHEERDLRRGTTTAGPHRHDLRLSLKGRSLRAFGSAGQQRTAAIALRLLEADTIGQRAGEPPLGLYDDVFAELDRSRQERLLDLVGRSLAGQAIITAPRESEVPPELMDRPRWTIERGRLVQ